MEDHTDFGHFSLSLNASQVQSEATLSHTIAKVKSLLDDYVDGFSANAIRNLVGVFYFYNKAPEESLKFFQDVLHNDTENLNALANQVFVYKRLFRTRKAEETYRKLEEILSSKNGVAAAVQKAECGFAYLFDCYMNNVRPRWDRCSSIFEEALNELEPLKDMKKRIKLEIKFWTMQSYQKRYDTDVRDQIKHQETFNKAVKIINQITEELGTDEMKDCRNTKTVINVAAVSQAYLGTFFFKKPDTKWNERGLTEVDETKIPPVIEDTGRTEEFKDPRICFKKALEENPNNREVRIRYANYLRDIRMEKEEATENNRKRLDEALEHVNHSLSLDDSESNWFGRFTKASIYFSKYQLFKSKNDLETAISDWEIADSFHHTSRIYSQLANAYRLMALKDGSDTELELDKDEYITKACVYFWKSVQMLGTQKRPEIHRCYGRFLRDLGDKREAIECFKRAMEIDTAHKPTKSFEHLFETFLQMYEEDVRNLPNGITESDEGSDHRVELRVDRLLFEIAFWFRFAIKKYKVLVLNEKDEHSEAFKLQKPDQKFTRSYSVQTDMGIVPETSDMKAKEAANLFEKHTRRFSDEYKTAMAHLCAYFESVTGSYSDRISKMIQQSASFKSTEDVEWNKIMESWTRRRSKLSQHSGIASCPACGNLTNKLSYSEPPERARNEIYTYDFYVVYPENQREWVLYSLIQKLEGVYGFKGAINDRDTLPGGNIFKSISHLIENCHRVLVVLTREFYQDRWCMHSLDLAESHSYTNKRDNFIIPILLESTDLSADRFSTIICLDGVEYFDWDKLVRSINQR
ncbi:unnamed protein product [Mytilus coruscus]|uniref:TIR domain-containing protein n=1 Tax=Mytilus coruscus TaxID=42192 RepID=A0A6J8DCJ0_MYTCO|nr:unnamed protein product [Mytilus coruscus]